jgi:hypothetical protein
VSSGLFLLDFGPRFGLRQMVLPRFFFGWGPHFASHPVLSETDKMPLMLPAEPSLGHPNSLQNPRTQGFNGYAIKYSSFSVEVSLPPPPPTLPNPTAEGGELRTARRSSSSGVSGPTIVPLAIGVARMVLLHTEALRIATNLALVSPSAFESLKSLLMQLTQLVASELWIYWPSFISVTERPYGPL